MTQKRYTEIPKRQKCINKEEPYIGGAKDIFDDELGKPQSQVNQEEIANLAAEVERAQQAEGVLDGKVATEKQRAEGVEGGLNTRLQTVEALAEISVGGGDIGIGTAADFESDDPEDLAKVPTISAMLGGTNDGVYDISARHSGATYADLSAALGTDGANIPASLRRGGMSVKFVSNSDNNYVQYRLMSDSFNTTVANWQGVDDVPAVSSQNLIKSGGVGKFARTQLRASGTQTETGNIFINPSERYLKVKYNITGDVNIIAIYDGGQFGPTIEHVNGQGEVLFDSGESNQFLYIRFYFNSASTVNYEIYGLGSNDYDILKLSERCDSTEKEISEDIRYHLLRTGTLSETGAIDFGGFKKYIKVVASFTTKGNVVCWNKNWQVIGQYKDVTNGEFLFKSRSDADGEMLRQIQFVLEDGTVSYKIYELGTGFYDVEKEIQDSEANIKQCYYDNSTLIMPSAWVSGYYNDLQNGRNPVFVPITDHNKINAICFKVLKGDVVKFKGEDYFGDARNTYALCNANNSVIQAGRSNGSEVTLDVIENGYFYFYAKNLDSNNAQVLRYVKLAQTDREFPVDYSLDLAPIVRPSDKAYKGLARYITSYHVGEQIKNILVNLNMEAADNLDNGEAKIIVKDGYMYIAQHMKQDPENPHEELDGPNFFRLIKINMSDFTYTYKNIDETRFIVNGQHNTITLYDGTVLTYSHSPYSPQIYIKGNNLAMTLSAAFDGDNYCELCFEFDTNLNLIRIDKCSLSYNSNTFEFSNSNINTALGVAYNSHIVLCTSGVSYKDGYWYGGLCSGGTGRTCYVVRTQNFIDWEIFYIVPSKFKCYSEMAVAVRENFMYITPREPYESDLEKPYEYLLKVRLTNFAIYDIVKFISCSTQPSFFTKDDKLYLHIGGADGDGNVNSLGRRYYQFVVVDEKALIGSDIKCDTNFAPINANSSFYVDEETDYIYMTMSDGYLTRFKIEEPSNADCNTILAGLLS